MWRILSPESAEFLHKTAKVYWEMPQQIILFIQRNNAADASTENASGTATVLITEKAAMGNPYRITPHWKKNQGHNQSSEKTAGSQDNQSGTPAPPYHVLIS